MSISMLISHIGGAFVSVNIHLHFFIAVTHNHNLASAVEDAVMFIADMVFLGIDDLDLSPRMAAAATVCEIGPDR